MRTFIVGSAKVVGSGGDSVHLTYDQFNAAKVLREACLSQEELLDVMEQLRDEPQRACMAKPKGKPVQDDLDWLPKKVAPSVAVPVPAFSYASRNTDGWDWQKIADLGPEYKVRAVKAYRDIDHCGLKEAVDKVNFYLEDRRKN